LYLITVDWESGTVRIRLSWESEQHDLVATGLRNLKLPHEFPWGPSNWINKLIGLEEIYGGQLRLGIEVQSGDVIEIVAEKFNLPPDRPMPEAGQLRLGK